MSTLEQDINNTKKEVLFSEGYIEVSRFTTKSGHVTCTIHHKAMDDLVILVDLPEVVGVMLALQAFVNDHQAKAGGL